MQTDEKIKENNLTLIHGLGFLILQLYEIQRCLGQLKQNGAIECSVLKLQCKNKNTSAYEPSSLTIQMKY